MLVAACYVALAAASMWSSYTKHIPYIIEYSRQARAAQSTDYPSVVEDVILPFEETVHYGVGQEGEYEWLWGFPQGGGWAVRGDNFETGYFPLYHELHCLEAIAVKPYEEPGHTSHCLTILRQSALCEPDLSLEYGDFEERNFELERDGPVRVCGDWEAVRKMTTRKWNQWKDVREGASKSVSST